jgi:hypothetical protein
MRAYLPLTVAIGLLGGCALGNEQEFRDSITAKLGSDLAVHIGTVDRTENILADNPSGGPLFILRLSLADGSCIHVNATKVGGFIDSGSHLVTNTIKYVFSAEAVKEWPVTALSPECLPAQSSDIKVVLGGIPTG